MQAKRQQTLPSFFEKESHDQGMGKSDLGSVTEKQERRHYIDSVHKSMDKDVCALQKNDRWCGD